MYSPTISKIKPNIENYSLLILFSNCTTKEIDMHKRLNEEFYCEIKNKEVFQQVQIDVGGYGVSWNDDIDMSEFELWNIGVEMDYEW